MMHYSILLSGNGVLIANYCKQFAQSNQSGVKVELSEMVFLPSLFEEILLSGACCGKSE